MGNYNLVYDIDVEKAVLAACLLSQDVVKEAVRVLSPEDFYRPAHQIIFRTMEQLAKAGTAVSAITVAHRLAATESGEGEEMRYKSYLAELMLETYALVGWRENMRIVREYSTQRSIARAALQILSESCRPQADFGEYLEHVREQINGALSRAKN